MYAHLKYVQHKRKTQFLKVLKNTILHHRGGQKLYGRLYDLKDVIGNNAPNKK